MKGKGGMGGKDMGKGMGDKHPMPGGGMMKGAKHPMPMHEEMHPSKAPAKKGK